MKKLFILIIVLTGISNVSQAQLEVTTNPIGLFAKAYALSVDYNIDNKFSVGMEGALIDDESETNFIYANVRYHFTPTERGNDRFYLGIFSGQSSYKSNFSIYNQNSYFNDRTTQIGIGGMVGYKAVSRHNIILDFGIGLGKGWGSDDWLQLLPYLKLNLGYRFNVKPKVTPKSLN